MFAAIVQHVKIYTRNNGSAEGRIGCRYPWFHYDFVFRIEKKALLIFFVSIAETDNAIWYRIENISGRQPLQGL